MLSSIKLIFICAFVCELAAAASVAQSMPQQPPPIIHTLDDPEFVPLQRNNNASTTQTAQQPSATVAVPDKSKSKSKVLEDANYWQNIGIKQLKKTIEMAMKSKETAYKNKAKNIIIFVGDGMGITTITAGRIYKGQYLKHGHGEEETLSFDNFPYTAFAKTYNVDKQVPDSASTATAMFSGIKTDYNAVGMDTTRSATDENKGRLTSIMEWAQDEGKRTGIVTTTRITHATPAATYAHIYHRDWECDTKVPTESKGKHVDIARQLIENAPGNKFNVILGGGLSPMGALNKNETRKVNFEGDTETICTRGDGRNLVEEWLKLDEANVNASRIFVQTREQLLKINDQEVEHLMGLFRNNHITYAIAKEKEEPSLEEMTLAAIRVLQRKDSKGYVLLVEGGRIDQAHHQNYAHAAMHEVFEFDKAIQAALQATASDETLIIVTADHSHSVTLNGYPARGNDILGFANKDDDPMVYETIMYANGPGYWDHMANGSFDSNAIWIPMERISAEQRSSVTYRHMATLGRKDESHGGEDVGVFAYGPGASLIRGVFEQNYLAYVMSYAGCMGPAKNFDKTCTSNYRESNAAAKSTSVLLLMLVTALSLLNI